MSKILVIEDDTEMAAMLKAILQSQHDVEICTEKAHAIRLARERFMSEDPAPDCVVIDLIINGTGGVEFYSWMREQGHTCPVIFLTGCHQQSPEYRAALATGEHIYEKDHFSALEFLEKVAEHVVDSANAFAD